MRYNIKPISVNEAYTGRRFKSPAYKSYIKHLTMLLKPIKINPESRLSVFIKFGFSSHGSDLDNGVKPLLDIVQKKYGINDNKIYKMELEKEVVPKGKEFIELEIKELI